MLSVFAPEKVFKAHKEVTILLFLTKVKQDITASLSTARPTRALKKYRAN